MNISIEVIDNAGRIFAKILLSTQSVSRQAQEVMAAASEEQLASMQEVTASASALSKMAQNLQQLLSQFTI